MCLVHSCEEKDAGARDGPWRKDDVCTFVCFVQSISKVAKVAMFDLVLVAVYTSPQPPVLAISIENGYTARTVFWVSRAERGIFDEFDRLDLATTIHALDKQF